MQLVRGECQLGSGLKGSGADTTIMLDRAKILTTGKKAVGVFLQKLNVYKATADVDEGISMYKKYTSVPDDMLPLRQVVLAQKQPRKLFVQHVTVLAPDGSVGLNSYSADPNGMVCSFVDRFEKSGPLGGLVDHLSVCGPHRFPAK